ncbi:MAG: M20/M25/M40 family metallo-hydrolase [Campylobacterales bacterium]|nr:M20/M25/M40 family metallo-hydrolase [Campylobacterales bacterium]
MSKILNYFIELTQIPHCSKDTTPLRDYLVKFAMERDYTTLIDSSDNILISKGSPNLALQAHYDMVCVGKAPQIQTYEQEGWLRAKDSSLGADNGIAIAMMMELMDRGEECEFLLTSDEEIGLIGAKALNFELRSNCMLNLDSEDEAEVYIGCAGGEDIVANKSFEVIQTLDDTIYEVSVNNLQGGHSGVDIDKAIPSAIKVLVAYLKRVEAKIIAFEGGERRNSIPANAKALIYCPQPLPSDNSVTIKKVEGTFELSHNNLLDTLDSLPHGVLQHNSELNIPNSSANLALVKFVNNHVTLTFTTRGMSSEALALASNSVIDVLKAYRYDYQIEENYPAWRPDINSFTDLVNEAMAEEFGSSKLMAIHAGLECGILSSKYPHIAIASIGPTIKFPHSTSEKLKIDSVEKIFNVVCKIIEQTQE